MNTIITLAEAIPCRYCGAPPEASCTTEMGERTREPHISRTGPAERVWSAGFNAGQQDVVGALDRKSAWGDGYIQRIRNQMRKETTNE